MCWSIVLEVERLIVAIESDIDKVATVKMPVLKGMTMGRMLALETVKLEPSLQMVIQYAKKTRVLYL